MADFPQFMTDYRALARDLLHYLGGDLEPWGNEPGETSSQRQITDPVYARGLVEGRKYKPPASSCGDAPHCLYFRLGVRFDWVNRAEHHGWEYLGARNNITRLTAKKKFGVNPIAKVSTSDDYFECGDVLIVNVSDPNTTHALCVLHHDPNNGTILSMESGQPGAAIRLHKCVPDGGRWKIGKRHVDSWLPLDSLIYAAQEADQLSTFETAEVWASRLSLPAPGTFYSGMRSKGVQRAQARLKAFGFSGVGPADGAFGAATQSALKAYQQATGLSVTGQLDLATQASLSLS